jgi:hypothetical protein
MWIFTSRGMLSIVEHRDDPDTILVRARTHEHLAAFIDTRDIFTDDSADYKHRALIPREQLESLMLSLADEVDYDNFKKSILNREQRYSAACHEVWATMNTLQYPRNDWNRGNVSWADDSWAGYPVEHTTVS